MINREDILNLLRDEYPHLASEYGVKRIGLFGSFAKGQAGSSSDIDLFVEFEHPLGFKFIDLAEHLETLFGRKVDVLTPAGIQGIRIARIAREIMEGIVYV